MALRVCGILASAPLGPAWSPLGPWNLLAGGGSLFLGGGGGSLDVVVRRPPIDVREEPGGALFVHVKADVFLQVSDHPSKGWERPKQAGWEFKGLRV